jgi:hypothetical protein
MPTRSSLSVWGRFKQSLWVISERLRESDKLYALKVGIATGALAAPAFFETTRPAFTHYRGEWALISVRGSLVPTASTDFCCQVFCSLVSYNWCSMSRLNNIFF